MDKAIGYMFVFMAIVSTGLFSIERSIDLMQIHLATTRGSVGAKVQQLLH